MSQDIASLFIKVDSKGVVTASKDLDQLTGKSRQAERATDSVNKSFQSQIRLLKQLAVAYGAYKLAKYVKDVTLLAARYETLAVVMHKVGNNAGYTSLQMDDFQRSLEKTGISMVQSRNTLARMIQAQIDLTQATALGRIAQDSAVIGNMNSSEAFEHMIYGIQAGMPRILRTIGLNVSFQKSYEELGVTLGKTTEQLTEKERVQARVNAVQKAGVLIQGTYTAAMDTAGKQLLSFERHWENLKSLLGQAFTPALAEIIEQITEAVKGINAELGGDSEDAIRDWGANFRLTIIDIIAEVMRLGMFLDKVGGTISSMSMLLYGPGAALGFESSKEKFNKSAQYNLDIEQKYLKTETELIALAEKRRLLEESMTPAARARAKATRELAEAKTLALRQEVEETEIATAKMLKIQERFVKEYNRLTMTTEDFETASLNTRVEKYREAGVAEIQIAEYIQVALRDIKLRAQNEKLALIEELASQDRQYEEEAIEIMSEILDAEEEKWAKILDSDEQAHELRIKREEEYADKIMGVIDEVVHHERQANEERVRMSRDMSGGGSGSVMSKSTGGGIGTSFTQGEKGFSSGLPTGVVAGLTWDTYIGWMTPEIERLLDANQKKIELEAGRPERERLAKEASDKIAAAGQRAAEEAERMAEAAAQRMADIAAKNIDLNIRILELTGHEEEALAMQRMLELSTMDATSQELQKRIYYLEDEAEAAEKAAEAAEKAAEAAEKAAEAMEALVDAQDASLKTWEDSIAVLVSQGQAIKDFINSLGVTGISMTLSAARATYAADLAGARAGDPTSYGRITQSAGTYISTAGQTAGSSLEMARIVAGIKNELSNLQPVVDLDSNIELLKAIREATKDTATATQRLDILGIKAIFDLEQTLTLVDNSDGLPDYLKEMIVAQAGDYQLTLQAQLASGTSDDLKRILIDGAGIYATTVNAAIGTVDAQSQKLALTATGTYAALVNSIMGNDGLDKDTKRLALTAGNTFLSTVNAALGFTDPGAVALAIETANDLAATVTAALGSGDTDALKLATEKVNSFATTVTAALSTDATTQQLQELLTSSGNVTTTVDGTMSWNPNDPMKSIWNAILAQTAATATNTGRLYVAATIETHPGWQSEYGWIPPKGNIYWSNGTVSYYAKGGVFSQGNIIPFAAGGIFDSPHMFPTANGAGMLGEAGPEAIMPLTRIGGKLGVRSEGKDNVILIEEVRALRAEAKAGSIASVRNSNKIAKILARFDDDGLPAERTS